jgi:cell wall-associated NlpC family hydrolase
MYDKRMAGRVLAWTGLHGTLRRRRRPRARRRQGASAPVSLSAAARASATQAASKVWHGAQDVALFALGLLGVDYRFGGTTPERGLDCSGLVQYVFQEVTGATLPRTSAR